MGARIISIAFQAGRKFELKRNEKIDLQKLEQECLKHGIKPSRGRGILSAKIDKITFNVYEDGNIGRCYSPDLDGMKAFETHIADFFWENFVVNCIKKKELVK